MQVLSPSAVHTREQKGNFSTWTRFKWAALNDISASVTLCRDSSTLPSAAVWNADSAPCSIWRRAMLTERNKATCVQFPLVPALLYTDGNIQTRGGQQTRTLLRWPFEKQHKRSPVNWCWETREGITMVRDKIPGSEALKYFDWGTAGRASARCQPRVSQI